MADAQAPQQWPPSLSQLMPRARTGARLGLRVLCVEDDEQTLAVLAALLESEGYEVATAVRAEQGLELLRAGTFHLLVSDYWLPDKTGAWMVREAAERGYLRDTRVLMVTAEHRPQGIENLRVLPKPLDLDDFLAVVHDELEPMRESELARARQDLQRTAAADGAAKVSLVLYISASSPSSLKAVRNLQKAMAHYDQGEVQLTLCDLAKEPSKLAEIDRIAFTPTLVRHHPAPKVWILGDLERAEVVHDLFALSGLKRTQ